MHGVRRQIIYWEDVFFFIFGSSAHFGTEEYGRFVEIWILASDGAEFLYNVTDCISLDHRSVAINNQVMCKMKGMDQWACQA